MTLYAVENLSKSFSVGSRFSAQGLRVVQAADGVSLQIEAGETLGLVGESGCGNATLARLCQPSAGRPTFEGVDITSASAVALRPIRARLRMVFQDPYASLNPRRRVADPVAEPLRIHARLTLEKTRSRVDELLEQVGRLPDHADRYPHEFSGGQRQRVGIARAIALNPRLLIPDEPVSALDVSVQAQIVNLPSDLQERLSLTYVFVAHDLSVVRQVSTRIAVMYLGSIGEIGSAGAVFSRPRHPCTRALISAVPKPVHGAARQRIIPQGDVPSPIAPPPGCRFHPRCAQAQDRCKVERPALVQGVACHFPLA